MAHQALTAATVPKRGGGRRRAELPSARQALWLAGFCLIANGAYLGVGAFDPVGDAGQLLQHGASAWQLAGFGLVTAPLGLFLWHGQGTHFGLGKAGGRVQPFAAYLCLVLFLVVATAEFLLGGE